MLTDGQESKDHVLFRVTWPTNDEVVAVIENRVQNEAVIRRCQVDSLTCVTVSEKMILNIYRDCIGIKTNLSLSELADWKVYSDWFWILHLILFAILVKSINNSFITLSFQSYYWMLLYAALMEGMRLFTKPDYVPCYAVYEIAFMFH